MLEGLERQIHRPGGTGLLDREAFSSDIGRQVVALHGQAVVWRALVSIGRAWAKLGQPRLAARATAAARRLEQALRSAVRASQRRLSDGSLFVPAALLDGTPPFDRVTASREGSYWNLVMPYALASGLFDPKGREAEGIWEYMQHHGSRLLGLVRADADRLYRGAPSPASGVDQVYGLNMARFLADADLPDQLVLSLYGTLAGAMTRNTFVAGEAATVALLSGLRLGAMYLPPNGGTNTAFLETLRVMLVHERRNRQGAPKGLELAFATPRGWLGNGKAIRVRDAPTSFGPVSFAIERRGRTLEISVDAPPTPDLRLRLRLPRGLEIGSIGSGGVAMPFDRCLRNDRSLGTSGLGSDRRADPGLKLVRTRRRRRRDAARHRGPSALRHRTAPRTRSRPARRRREPSAYVSPAAKLSPAPYASTTSPGGAAAVNGPPGRAQPPRAPEVVTTSFGGGSSSPLREALGLVLPAPDQRVELDPAALEHVELARGRGEHAARGGHGRARRRHRRRRTRRPSTRARATGSRSS